MSGFLLVGAGLARDGQDLLGPLDLQIPAKGITALMGENGSGKSLLLDLLHGMTAPSMGTVSWNGTNVADNKRDRGFIFQHNVVLRRSVAKNIRFTLSLSGVNEKRQDKRLSELLALVKLEHKADQPAALLSGGELQRMALARALAVTPKYLLIDEPTSSLDPKSTLLFENIILSLRDAGMGVIWATHDAQQARRCADRVVFLSEGKVVETGSAPMIFDHPESETAQSYFPT